MKRPNSSMQLTRAADYGVRVMIQLAVPAADGRVSLPALAKATGAPESFLSKVLQALARAGLISSRRGQAGGFRISPRGRVASMLEVIEAIDGAICLNVCMTPGRSCARKVALSRASGLGRGAAGHARRSLGYLRCRNGRSERRAGDIAFLGLA